MDAFFYIIDMFAFASDEEGLPTNEDNGTQGSGGGGCVVAWDAHFPLTFDELLRHHRTCVLLFLDLISLS